MSFVSLAHWPEVTPGCIGFRKCLLKVHFGGLPMRYFYRQNAFCRLTVVVRAPKGWLTRNLAIADRSRSASFRSNTHMYRMSVMSNYVAFTDTKCRRSGGWSALCYHINTLSCVIAKNNAMLIRSKAIDDSDPCLREVFHGKAFPQHVFRPVVIMSSCNLGYES